MPRLLYGDGVQYSIYPEKTDVFWVLCLWLAGEVGRMEGNSFFIFSAKRGTSFLTKKERLQMQRKKKSGSRQTEGRRQLDMKIKWKDQEYVIFRTKGIDDGDFEIVWANLKRKKELCELLMVNVRWGRRQEGSWIRLKKIVFSIVVSFVLFLFCSWPAVMRAS